MTYLEQPDPRLRPFVAQEIQPILTNVDTAWDHPAEQTEPETAVSSFPNSQHEADSLTLVGLALFILLLYMLINGLVNGFESSSPLPPPQATAVPPPPPDPALVVSPYDNYVLTQGVHGQSYGHLAIDIAGGKNSPIYSPIHGEVTAVYTDQYGNPTLVIENERYAITMLHGLYEVTLGQSLTAGQFVGKESNLGYTTDMRGYPCTNRDCGYHTHLNIFDKQLQANINPLTVLPAK